MKKTKTIVFLGLMVALTIVLTEMAKLLPYSSTVRAPLSFIPIALCAALFGPLPAGFVAAVADVLSYFLFPSGGPFFPGFTVSAFLAGVLFAIPLYKKHPSLPRSLVSSLLVILICNVGLSTFFVHLLYGIPFIVLLVPRMILGLIMIPVETLVIFGLWRSLKWVKAAAGVT